MQLFKPHNERNKTLDVAKGLIILVVVTYHIFASQGGTNNNALAVANGVSEDSVPIMLLYLCLMLFFIISGYLFNKERTIGQNLKRNGGKLFLATAICMLVLPIILAGFVVLNGQTPDFSRYLETHIYPIFGSGEMLMPYGDKGDIANQLYIESGYYFVSTMVAAFFFFYAFAYRFLEDDRKTVVSILVLITLTCLMRQFLPVRPPLYLDLAPISAAFMMFGAWMAKKKVVERMEERGWKNPKVVLGVVISLIAAFALLTVLPTGMGFHITYFGQYTGLSAYPFFIIALLCCFVSFFIFTIIAKIPVFSDLLALLGRHSLGIILLSMFITKCIASFFFTLPLENTLPLMGTVATVCILIATLMIDLFIVIYGKKLFGRIVEKKTASPEA